MKNRRHYIISFVFLVLLIVELAGCAAGAASENSSEEDLDKTERTERTVWETLRQWLKEQGKQRILRSRGAIMRFSSVVGSVGAMWRSCIRDRIRGNK